MRRSTHEIRKLQQQVLDLIGDVCGSNVQTVRIDEHAVRLLYRTDCSQVLSYEIVYPLQGILRSGNTAGYI